MYDCEYYAVLLFLTVCALVTIIAPPPTEQYAAVRCGVWCDVVWCDVVWCGVVWSGVVWCSLDTF